MKHKRHSAKEIDHNAMPDEAGSNGYEKKTLEHVEPAHGEIAALAYSLWTKRESHEGSAEEDWYRAEEQLRASTK